MSEREQANQLALDVAKLRGIEGRAFSPKGTVAYGTLQFQHIDGSDSLMVLILVSEDEMWDQLGEEFRSNYLKATNALSDPRVGGMFDTAGARWRFEPAGGRTFLYKTYSLDTPPQQIALDIEALSELVPAWETRWSSVVAGIAHGRIPPPVKPVTLQDDPYKDQF